MPLPNGLSLAVIVSEWPPTARQTDPWLILGSAKHGSGLGPQVCPVVESTEGVLRIGAPKSKTSKASPARSASVTFKVSGTNAVNVHGGFGANTEFAPGPQLVTSQAVAELPGPPKPNSSQSGAVTGGMGSAW